MLARHAEPRRIAHDLLTAASAGVYTVTVEPENATTGTQVLLIRRP